MSRPDTPPALESSEPLVSVITVNYNGAYLLGDLLRSLEAQSYRNHEILVVDNGSTDGSVELLDREFPHVRVLRQPRNAGFAGGNNAGIRASNGELVALVNNDTVAEPRWLEELVESALADPSVAAVGSKILFFRPFLPLHLAMEGQEAAGDARSRGAEEDGFLLDEDTSFEGCSYRKPIFKEGFLRTRVVEGRRTRRATRRATLFLPVDRRDEAVRLRLVVAGGDARARRSLRLRIGSTELPAVALEPGFLEHSIEVPAAVTHSESFDVINNAGTTLSPSGETADRGIYEPDVGQFDLAEEIEAFCGAAVLLRRTALEDVGLFDRDFFMYFEDADLSWRLRRNGYRLQYDPRSVIRHLHATSSVEWSPLFTFHTARNKILMIVKNGGFGAIVRAYGHELVHFLACLSRAARTLGRPSGSRFRREAATRFRVHLSLLHQVPRALLKRAGLIAH